MYLDTLGREPDPTGLATWVDWIRSGRFTVAQAAALFYSSQEFYSGIGGGTETTWVTKLYEKLLNRAPDPSGLEFRVGYAAVSYTHLDVYKRQSLRCTPTPRRPGPSPCGRVVAAHRFSGSPPSCPAHPWHSSC